jgi:hypothetical protein
MAGRQAAEAVAGTYGKHVSLNGGRNEAEHAVLSAVKKVFDDIAERGGVDPASFLNMHPWSIYSTGPLLDGISIPECPIGQPFTQFVHKDVRIDYAETPSGIYSPSAVWPIVLMRDILRQHEQWGGMVVYMGDVRLGESKRKPSAQSIVDQLLRDEKNEDKRALLEQLYAQQAVVDTRYASSAEVGKLMAKAEADQIAYYRKRCNQVGVTYESDTKTAFRSIMPNDRLMARWLFHRGIYATLPKWVTQERPDDYKPKGCAKCGKDVDPKGFACPACNYIHDGIKAFVAGEVDEAHVSLKRHTRAELDAAGLTHVLTLEEERKTEAKKAKDKGTK